MNYLRTISAIVISATIVVGFYRVINVPAAQLQFPEGNAISIWEWRSPVEFSAPETEELLTLMNEEGISTIYIDISSYIDIHESKLPTRNAEYAIFIASLKRFVLQARSHDIAVEALAGDTRWGNASHRYIPEVLMEFVLQYNRSVMPDEQLRGIQFDIEFYNQPAFAKNRDALTVEFLDTVGELVHLASSDSLQPPLRLGFAAPYWLDNSNGSMPALTWNGSKDLAFRHLLSVLDVYDESYIVLMAYSDHTDGKNGIIQKSTGEIQAALESAPSVGIIIGIETKDVKPSGITFFGETRNTVKKAARRVSEAFVGNANFEGFAVHDTHGYFTLVK